MGKKPDKKVELFIKAIRYRFNIEKAIFLGREQREHTGKIAIMILFSFQKISKR